LELGIPAPGKVAPPQLTQVNVPFTTKFPVIVPPASGKSKAAPPVMLVWRGLGNGVAPPKKESRIEKFWLTGTFQFPEA